MNDFNDISDDGLITLSGSVKNIVYHNDDNGYTVCQIDADGEDFTAVGIMPYVNEGEYITLKGSFVVHKTYGEQFKVEFFEKRLPTNSKSIQQYLSSGVIRGIGPKTAARIVFEFGDETFDIIENSPHLLAEIKGINMKKAEEINRQFKNQFASRAVLMFFQDFFGVSLSNAIYKKLGPSAVEIVHENPYVLCNNIDGIGFERADKVAASIGYAPDSENRICAAIKYVLNFNSASNGHVYLPREKLAEAVSKLIDVPVENIQKSITNMETTGQIIIEKNDAVYLFGAYNAEKYCALKLSLLSKINLFSTTENIDEIISATEEEEGIQYSSLQKKAIRNAIINAVSILTGGPGTGKTTIIKAILQIFYKLGMKVSLAAPTGRAAKRMSESTGAEAKTIHRLLEFEFSADNGEENMRFFRNENNLLESDVVIIDEASMIDIFLFSSLLKAIKPGARLILIGDSDQLPSVGAGNVLNDIIESNRFAVCSLTQIFRQAKESLIILNAHRINRGEMPELTAKNGDFFFLPRRDAQSTVRTIAELISTRLPRSYGEQIKDRIQVISSTKKGTSGTISLNAELQKVLNPHSPELNEHQTRDIIFREGDRVIQTRNNYDIDWYKTSIFGNDIEGMGIFNGDIGVIEEIDNEEEYLRINFDGRIAKYTFDLCEEIEHAYAITVHKSQGSEYPIVIMPICQSAPMLQTRNLLYTAITRAQTMVILVGDGQVIERMVENNRHSERYTGLVEFLKSNG
ncbi:MAG: ATP-dependent RecD-like DNA helicase [Clostridia bacterium]|nr:ATP-dependent RecD-like DNA helicase [Clostridia bacterium]